MDSTFSDPATMQLFIWFLLTGFALVRIADLKIHYDNSKFLRFAGAVKATSLWSKFYFGGEWLLVGMAVAELFWRGASIAKPIATIAVVGLLMGTLLHIWSLRSLGALWSMNLEAVPGIPRVVEGPYRFMRHPEFLARALEVSCFCILCSAWVSWIFYALLLCITLPRLSSGEAMMLRRFSTEADF